MPKIPTPYVFDRASKRVSPVIGKIHAAVQVENNERSEKYVGKRALYLSGIGKCPRSQWLKLNGVPEDEEGFPPTVLCLFRLGDVIEDHVVELLEKAGFEVQAVDPETGDQWQVLSHNGQVRGRTDGKIVVDGQTMVLEIKSCNKNQFETLMAVSEDADEEISGYELWKPEYGAQIQSYMGLQGIDNTLVVVYCKDNSQMYSEVVPFRSETFTDLMESADRILTSEKILPKPDMATSRYSKYCKYCPFGDTCWSGRLDANFDD